MSQDLDDMRGTGNVFADVGDADAQAKGLKAKLAAAIIVTLNERRLTVREASKLVGMDEADVQRIRDADLSDMTVERLLWVMADLGHEIEIVSTPTNRRGHITFSRCGASP